MKLGILSQFYPPETGAPQARLSELARHFRARGHEVTVLTALPSYPRGRIYPGYRTLFRREELDGIRVLRTPAYPTRSAAMIPRLLNWGSFAATAAVAGTVLLPRLDYLLVESPPLTLGPVAFLLSRPRRAKLVFNVSDLWPESALRLGAVSSSSPAYRAAAALEAACYRWAWLVTGQSREIVASVRERFPHTRTYHLSNGVDTTLFRPEPPMSGAEEAASGGLTVMYAGLHGIAQGLGQLLDAAARLPATSAARFVFVGDGPEREELVARARSEGLTRVEFLAARPRDEIPALLARADILVVPLKDRIPGAVPSKLYEAMAVARPVILIAEGEPAGIVETSGAGIVVAPGDVDGIVDAVLRLEADPDLRATLGRNGRRAAVERYDRAAIAVDFAELLEAELAAGGNAVEDPDA